jgi:uncharacterized protein (TIGR04222 family)
MDVLDWNGLDFLQFYATALALTTVAACVARWIICAPGSPPPGAQPQVDTWDAAYLAGGPKRAVDTALASLIHAQEVTISITGGFISLHPQSARPAAQGDFADTVYASIAEARSTVERMRSDARRLTAPMLERLRELGLIPTLLQGLTARLISALFPLTLLALGVAKINIGLSRNRPVLFLVILCAATCGITLFFAARPCYRTWAGQRMLWAMRRQSGALKSSVSLAPDRLPETDIALAVALFGPAVLTSGMLLRLREVILPPGRAWGGGSGCGFSSCGGGGCGGGGGGGGGCGGCGGGGH